MMRQEGVRLNVLVETMKADLLLLPRAGRSLVMLPREVVP